MARALHGISRALNRFRINSAGPGRDVDSDEEDDEDTDESINAVMHATTSRRSGEKRKISTADAESGGDRSSPSTSSGSVGTSDRVPTPFPTSGPSYMCKRRKSPVGIASSLCCSTKTRDKKSTKAHTYVFRVKSKTSLQSESSGGPQTSSCSTMSEKSYGTESRRRSSMGESEVRVSCEMGDVWTEAYYEQPIDRHKDLSTGRDLTDKIIRNIEFHGYSPQCQIGSGKFGSVLLAMSRNKQFDRYVAVKFIRTLEQANEQARTESTRLRQAGLPEWHHDIPDEVLALKNLHHPNIVTFYEYLNISGRHCIVMEFCENGNIDDLIRHKPSGFFTETIARRYFHGMFAAVEYLHHQCIVHRDIKCTNFITDKRDNVKLCDFGSAKGYRVGDAFLEDYPGSSGYFPPEFIRRVSYNPRQSDIWCLGIVLYVMLTGRLPLTTDTQELMNVFESARSLPFPSNNILILTAQAKSLVSGMCMFSPELRWSLARIRSSDWFNCLEMKVAIGNYYLARQPQKVKCGAKELKEKRFLDL